MRCDVLVARLAAVSRSRVAGAVKRGDVRINGIEVKGSAEVAAGDTLAFAIAALEPLRVLAEAIEIDIVYEDDDLIVVNKPAGMVTHPAHSARSGTLVNALLGHAGGLPGEKQRAGLIHRLDRDTSGLLVVAKTEATLGTLARAMKARYIEREYRGLVVGRPEHESGTLEGGIGRDPHNRLRFAVRPEGKPAVTHFALQQALRGATELVFRLETGRTHQIRVHMASFGYPLVNDPLYGRTDPRIALPGQALHAWRLRFRHPRTREQLDFEAPLPREYEAALDVFR